MGKRARSKNAGRVQDRLIDELIGISRGVIADGVVDEKEAIFIGQWIENHRQIAEKWPVNVVYARLTEMLKDGILSADEQAELLTTLRDLTGDTTLFQEVNKSTTLPVDRPEPQIEFTDKIFCLTGKFVYGPTLDCEEAIIELGGQVVQSPGKETDYLVIGELCSPDWVHTTFGRSIEKAVELKSGGQNLIIATEQHWVDCLSQH